MAFLVDKHVKAFSERLRDRFHNNIVDRSLVCTELPAARRAENAS